MTNETVSKSPRKPVLPWFGAFFVAIIAAGVALNLSDIKDPLVANLIMASPMVFIVKAGLNAMANAGTQGAVGSPTRNYLKRMLIVSLTYVGSLIAAVMLIDEGDPITPLSMIIAIVPGLAVVGYFWAIGRFILEVKDEFIRMLNIRQSLIATAISLSAASVWGFLENFEQVPHIDAYWWPILWFFGLGVGGIANKITYGTAGDSM
ncbi:hypothetical protein [Sphingomicrobium clamense]|uniref:Uncharacterized protein n=1 Tax=Sphingomicrobium clamense TaxID=2851013 RepID=A0ABS6V3I3_9SPHN|nr:hypothetical protein [Sphingomicrobium sp. B8]MBW0144111.1 hypothetical protein [Sphingomicrobium sp. B8]